jgi:hypothetical protein
MADRYHVAHTFLVGFAAPDSELHRQIRVHCAIRGVSVIDAVTQALEEAKWDKA